MPDLPTGTVTFLFTDIEGSTRLLEDLGSGYAVALADHRRTVRDAVARHGGVEVDTQGDAFFVAFARASDACAAAADAQAALLGGPTRVRMGIHSGEPTVSGDGYVGMDVHRGARIAAAGHGGQVLVSQATRALVPDVAMRDLGEHRLKDLSAPLRLWQLGDGEFAPLRTLHQTNLPEQATALVGRAEELAEATELLRSHRLVTLTGPGGSGKTRLALQLAADAVDAFPDGVWWVALATVADPSLVLRSVSQALGVTDDLGTHLGGKRLLLLLDNLEQVIDCAPELAGLLAQHPGLALLTTSREPLRIAGEREYPVRPLAERDALELFRERATGAAQADVVLAICRRVDCLPLAIELAAARTTLLSPSELLARLDQRLPVLTGGRRDAPERQRTLRATIEWSFDLLSPDEQRLFVRLGVFVGGFSVAMAESVADADLEGLQSLVDKSLVRRTDRGRLAMLETIHEFAAERLEGSAEAEEIRSRHAVAFVALAEAANLSEDADGEPRPEVVVEVYDDIRAALAWTLATGRIELGLRLAAALEHHWSLRDPADGILWLGRLLAVADDVPAGLRARAWRTYGSAASFLDADDAERAHRAGLEAARESGDERRTASLLHRVAVSAFYRGDLVEARALCEESLRIQRRLANRRGASQALGTLGQITYADGDRARARELLEQSATQAGEAGFAWWQARMLRTLAEHALADGDLAGTLSHGREALGLFAGLGDRVSTRYALAVLATAAAERGDAERAGLLWGAIDAEEERAPLGAWQSERVAFRARIPDESPAFTRGRQAGLETSIDDAIALETTTPP